ncbi:MAG: DegT/DnrJ/EryC1/StrS family aminotransferase [Planctomycetota bacterium]
MSPPELETELPCWPPDDASIRAALDAAWGARHWGAYQSDSQRQLEKRLETLHEGCRVRLCCSGTAGLELALRAAGAGPGNSVALAAYDYPGNFRTIESLGARPFLVDVATDGLSIDVDALLAAESRLGSVPAVALIASHLHGAIADMPALRKLCSNLGWLLIEDACQSPGVVRGGQEPASTWRIGSLSDFAVLSFGGGKPLTAGNGGALLCSNERLFARVRSIADRPSDAYPLSALQASVVLPQLDRLRQRNQLRSQGVDWLAERDWEALSIQTLATEPARDGSKPESNATQTQRCYYKWPIRMTTGEDRQAMLQRMMAAGWIAGEGFRAMSRVSTKRADRLGSLENSQRLSDGLIVIDQRMLLADREALHERWERLIGADDPPANR